MSDSKMTKESNLNINSSERKGSTGGDVTESEREYAQGALAEFNKNNFAASASFIAKLQSTRFKDIKVLSNKAVVDYYISGLKKTEAFQKVLSDICNQANIKLDDIKSSDEVEASVIRLNRCTVLFHLQQLQNAKSLLESMYNGLESLEESVSIGLCLLLVEVLLGLSLPGRALSVVAHTEATFLPQPLPPQTSSTKQLHTEQDSRSPDKSTGKENISNSMTHPNSNSSNSYSRTNIMNSHATSDPIGGSSEMRCSADQEILRGKLQLLRVRSLLQMKILRVAKKELKAIVNHAVHSGNPLNVTLIMLKSQLEYLKGSYKKAIKVLNQCSAIPPPAPSYTPCLSVAYYNNLGIIHIGLQKPTLACLYFKTSLNELKVNSLKDSKTDGSPLTQNLYSNSNGIVLQLCYNLGVTLMHMNKPSAAFDFLIEVVKSYSTNPRLWLRLAECCIMNHKLTTLEKYEEASSHRIIGSGTNQKICINPTGPIHDKKLSEQQANSDPAVPVISLEFARLCIRNCLKLIPENVSAAFLTDEQEASGVLPDLYSCNPSCTMKGAQIINVKLRCLACSSYASLCLGDYPLAFKHAQALLSHVSKVPRMDPILKLLGHMYAGEALILMGKISESISHFDPKQVGEIPLDEDVSVTMVDEKRPAWSTLNSLTANKLLQYNLSVSYSLRGQYDKANSILREIIDSCNENIPTQVIMLAIYVNLKLGYTDFLGTVVENGYLTPCI